MPQLLLLLLALSAFGPEPARRATPVLEAAEAPAAHACRGRLGFVGRPILELQPFAAVNGFSTGVALSAFEIPGLLASEPDVVFVLRSGADAARARALQLDAWVRDGGLLITEFTATQVLYEPGPLNYLDGALVDDFWVPSGTACGGNAIRVEVPGQPIAEGLPEVWPCSGDSMGTLQVFAGVDPRLCVVLSVVGSDRDGDGRDDPVLAVTRVGLGAVAVFFSDFGNFQPLEDPRECPGGPLSASCRRHPLDERVFLNVLCHARGPFDCSAGCGDCDALRRALDEAEISSDGVRRSLRAKAERACASLEADRPLPAGHQLCALLREAAAQTGRHLAPDSAQRLRACVEALAEAEGLTLGLPLGSCTSRPALDLPDPGSRF